MFNNIGIKIKTLAKVLAVLGIVGSILLGLIIIIAGSSFSFETPTGETINASSPAIAVVLGLCVMIFGSLSSWISNFILYGFGQLVENTDKMVEAKSTKK